MRQKKNVLSGFLMTVLLAGMMFFSMSLSDVSAASQNPTIGPGGGGGLFNSAINPQNENNIVMNTDMSGSFSSIDGGESFAQRNLLGSVKYSFNPHDPNIVYAYHRHIYISYDGGQSYERFYPAEDNIKSINSGLQEGVYVDLYDYNAQPTHTIFSLEVDPDDPNTIYYVAKAGWDGKKNVNAMLNKSTDNGKTWETVAEFPEELYQQLKFHRYSTNSFEKYMKILIDPESPVNERTITLMTSNGIFRVKDDGSGKMENISSVTSRFGDYTYDEATKKFIYYIVENEITEKYDENGNLTDESYKIKGVMRSADDGKTWKNISKNYADPQTGDKTFYGVAASGNTVYMSYMSTNGPAKMLGCGIAVSKDGGNTWETSLKGWDTGNILNHNWTEIMASFTGVPTLGWNGVKTGLSVSKSNPDVAVSTNHGNAYITRDGGNTWNDTNSNFDVETQYGSTKGVDQITSWDVDVDPFDPNHMFMCYSDVGLFESKDGGLNWKRSQNNGIPANAYYANSAYSFTFDPDVEGLCFVGMTGIHDMNIGTYIARIIKLSYLADENANRPAETVSGGVLRSTDGGETWQISGRLGTNPIRDDDGLSGLPDRAIVTDVVIDPLSPKEADKRVVYVTCMGYGVYRSEDGGQTFTKFIDGMEDAKRQMPWRLTWSPDYSRLYVIFAPTDAYNGNLALIDYHPDEGPVYYLERDAKEWTRIASMPKEGTAQNNRKGHNHVAVFNGLSVDSQGNIYAAGRVASLNGDAGKREYGGGWVSQDDGETWKMIYPSTANVYDLRVDSRNDNVLYLCNTVGGEVYVSYQGTETTFDDWIKLDEFQHMVPTRVMEDTRDPSYMYATTFGGGVWHLQLPQAVTTETHTLKYDGNGHTSGSIPKDTSSPYDKKSKATLLKHGTLANKDKTFVGWNTKADGSGAMYQSGDEYLIVRDTVLYAQWRDSAKKCTVTYDGNGSTSGAVPVDTKSPYAIKSEVEVLEIGNLVKEANLFTGWNTKADGSGTTYQPGEIFNIIDDVTLYAQWEVGLTVRYEGCDQGSGEVPLDSEGPYVRGTKITVLGQNTLEKEGYVFRGWSTRADYTGAVYKEGDRFTIMEDTVLYAQWKPAITLTYDGNGHTHGPVPVDVAGPYAFGETAKLTGAEDMIKDGCKFVGWNTKPDGSGEKTYTAGGGYVIKEDTVLYAVWEELTPTGAECAIRYVAANKPTGGTAPVDPNAPYAYGSTIQILDCGDLVKEGYKFIGWTNRAESGGRIYKPGQYVTIVKEMIMWSVWEEDASAGGDPEGEPRTLTYDGNGNTGGTVPVDPKSPYQDQALVTVLTDNGLAKAGHTFNGWNTQADGKGTAYAPGASFRINADMTLYAQWKAIPVESTECTIVYRNTDATGGSVPVDVNSPYLKNSVVEIMDCNTMVRTGYTFIGWNNRSESGGRVYTPGEQITITANMIMWPVWEKNEGYYSVDYYGNGNTGGKAPTDANSPYLEDSSVVVAGQGTLVREGYTFEGWNTEADGSGTSYQAGESFTITADQVLYAQWKPQAGPYTVTYVGNQQTSGTAPIDAEAPYAANSQVTLLAQGDLAKEGYTFDGWNTKADGSGISYQADESFTITEDMVFYAQWEKDPEVAQYTVVYEGNEHTSGDAPIDEDSPYEAGSSVTLLEPGDLEKEDYVFIGWNTEADGSGISYQAEDHFTITADMTFYAQWEKKCEVTYDGNGYTGGTVPVDSAAPYQKGSRIQILEAGDLEKTGYTFVAWNTEADGSGITVSENDSFVLNEDTTFYAQWREDPVEEETFMVTYDGNGNTSGNVPIDLLAPYAKDSEVTVLGQNNLAREGYTFIGWSLQPDGQGGWFEAGDSFTIGEEDIILYAYWEAKEYTVTYDGNGHTGGSLPVDEETYHIGDMVTVLAEADLVKAGYHFSGWNTAANGSGTAYQSDDTFAMAAADMILYAQWERDCYQVTYDGNGNTGGTVQVDATEYLSGDTLVVPGAAGLTKDGYTFMGWNTEADGSGSAYQAGELYTFDQENVTLYAQWKQNTVPVPDVMYTVTFDPANGKEATSVTVKSGQRVSAPANPVKAGYTFVGWFAEKETNAFSFHTPIAGNIKLTARWKQVTSQKETKTSLEKAVIKVKTVTYNGKKRKPAVTVTLGKKVLVVGKDYTVSYSGNKKPGQGTVTIKGIGKYEGSKTAKFNIKPKKNKIKKLTSKNGKVLIKFTKAKGVSGYQIRYSTKKNFKSAKSKFVKKRSVTLKGLKKNKKYYVKVRSYVKVGNKKIYSSFSKVKKVTVK